MSLPALLVAGRTAAAGLMTDTCTITRRAQGAFNPSTGTYGTGSSSLVYSGPCRVKPRNTADQVVEAGGEDVSLLGYVVSVPTSVTGAQVDDVVQVTSSASDPGLTGAQLRVLQVQMGSQITARRLGCEIRR